MSRSSGCSSRYAVRYFVAFCDPDGTWWRPAFAIGTMQLDAACPPMQFSSSPRRSSVTPRIAARCDAPSRALETAPRAARRCDRQR
jgi:hypothetical protein